jgi:hypothetical protein
MLNKFCDNLVKLEAEDMGRNSTTKLRELYSSAVDTSNWRKRPCLPDSLEIAIGARVRLVKNLSVTDGLINGAMGIVGDITFKSNSTRVECIWVKFDNIETGAHS